LQKHGLKRMFLHAALMRLPHPISGEVLALAAPLPQELAGFIAKIEKAADATL
jgi:23S rRNA pseudouridine955/2504/2580 synthase